MKFAGRTRTFAGLIPLLMTAVFPAAAASSPRDSAPQIVNVMPAFWAFQEELASLKTREETIRRFRQEIIEPHRQIYSKDQFRRNLTDDGIAEYLRQVQPDLGVMRSLSAQIEAQTRAASDQFAQMFPRFEGDVSIAYLPSFYRFDGQVTQIDGEHTLLFGLDGIARYHGANADLGVLFSHELFHIHHSRTSPALFTDEEHTPLYIGVWIEGLATYVSERLNPQASRLQIMLDDKALLDRGAPMSSQIAGMMLAHFESANPDDTGRFLSYGDKGDIPGRSGYLIGYQIAKKLGARHALPELAALEGEKLRSVMRAELSLLASAEE